MIPNTNTAGKVGVVLAFPVGQSIQIGTKQLVTIRFNVAPNAASGITPLTFADTPVFREVVDANADVLPTTFTDGNVNIFGPTAANISISGEVLTPKGRVIRQAFVTLTNADGESRSVSVNEKGSFYFTDVEAGKIYILTVRAKGYQFTENTKVITTVEDETDVDFIADNETLILQ